MPKQKQRKEQDDSKPTNLPPAFFVCPNSDCADFSPFDAGNLTCFSRVVMPEAYFRLHVKGLSDL